MDIEMYSVCVYSHRFIRFVCCFLYESVTLIAKKCLSLSTDQRK